jgi:hypothetical protein
MDWTKEEVSLIVADYFQMLQLELEHKEYNKTAHRKALIPVLNNRSNGSVEFKHQNISAALINMGLPYIDGYKPRFRYQKEMLEREIDVYVNDHRLILEATFEKFAHESNIKNLNPILYDNVLEDGPIGSSFTEREPLYKPIKINYLEKEQNNSCLGEEGERFVIGYERLRLLNAGKDNLADKIEWVSKKLGDGLGYDILSRNNNGTDRFIEVKTTKLAKETPIYVSRTEIGFASIKAEHFYLYRVFEFDKQPKLFIKQGNYDSFCKVVPQIYKGYF